MKKAKKYEVLAANGTRIATFRHQSEAEAYVRICERQDRYEVSIGYGFPNGLPVYSIREAA